MDLHKPIKPAPRKARICTLDGCAARHYALGLCELHYVRDRAGVDQNRPIRRRAPHGERSLCDISDCDRPVVSYGLCSLHHQRKRAGRELDAPVAPRFSTYEERFAHYALPPNDNGCRLWTGALCNGYGSVATGSRESGGGRPAHRVAYELATGETLKPYEAIHHKCAVRNCVEPSHLQKVSTVENGVEMLERNWLKRRIAELESALLAVAPESEVLAH